MSKNAGDSLQPAGSGSQLNLRAGLRMFDFHIVWIIVLCLCGMAAYQHFKFQVFPSASIEMTKPKAEIEAQAKQLAQELGFKKTNLIESTVFNIDRGAKNYLEHEFKLAEANRIMLTQVPVWSWRTRLCKEYDQEQFRSWISPTGQLVGFAHAIPNDAPGKKIGHDEAKSLALTFVQKWEKEPGRFAELIEDETLPRPKRTDHSFVWENQSTSFKEGRLRIWVHVSGDQVTNYNKYLHVPEKWSREFSTKRSVNDLLGSISFLFIRGLETLAAVIAVWGVITRNVRWRVAIFGGAVMGVLSSLDYLNNFPGLLSHYGVTSSFNSYVSEIVVSAGAHLIGDAIASAVLIAGAEIVYRKMFPKQIALEKLLTRDGLASLFVVRGAIVGYLFVWIYFGWMVFYYLCGQRLNYWCPLSIDSYQVLTDVVPFVSAIAFGAEASFREELVCRVIGLGVGLRLFRNFWLANLFQAVIWGFAHSSYPQEPAYARGIELTMEGLFQGWVLQKYGLVACITVHYLQDAFLYVEPYLNAQSLQLQLAVLPCLFPMAVLVGGALLLKWSAKKKQPKGRKQVMPAQSLENIIEQSVQCEAGSTCTPTANVLAVVDDQLSSSDFALTNESIPLQVGWSLPAKQPPPLAVTAMSTRLRLALTVVTLMGVLCFALFPGSYSINGNARMSITRHAAIEKARQVMKEHGVDPANWITTASSQDDNNAEAYQYMLEKSDKGTVRKFFDDTRRGYYWRVRFCKPLCSEEYTVVLDGNGNENSFNIDREEDDAGAKLTSEVARAKAQEYLARVHPEQRDCKFKEISSESRKNRTDYRVEFTNPTLKVGDADFRVTISVIGDQVGNYHQWWEVPDSWTFERRKSRFIDEILTHAGAVVLSVLCIVLLVGLALIAHGKTKLIKLSLARLKELYALPFSIRTIPVKIPYGVALASVAVTFMINVNFSPQFYGNYWTTVPLTTFVADRMLDYSRELFNSFIATFVLTYVCLIALAIAMPHSPIVPYLRQVLGRNQSAEGKDERRSSRNLWIDGILIAYTALAYTQISGHVWGLLNNAFSPSVQFHGLSCITSMSNVELPMLNIVLLSILAAVGTCSGLLVTAAFITRVRAFVSGEICRQHDQSAETGSPLPTTNSPYAVRNTVFGVLLTCVPLCGLECRNWQDFFLVTGFIYVQLFFFWLFATKLARGNYLAYFLFFACSLAITYLKSLLQNGPVLFVPESIVLSVMLVAPLVVAGFLWFNNEFEKTGGKSKPVSE